MSNERIKLTDTPMTSIMKMCEGNPGALTVLGRVLKEGGVIDPDAGFGQPIFILLNFDSLGLYGPNIWMLYKDVCGERLDKTIAVVRAWQMGFVTREQIHFAVQNRGAGLNVDEVCVKLKEHLPNFTFTEEHENAALMVAPDTVVTEDD